MNLDSVLLQLLQERELEKVTADQYRRSLRRFNEFLSRLATIEDLTPSNVNNFLIWLKSTVELSQSSILCHKIGLCVIWNYAASLNMIAAYDPRRLRTPKREINPVEAWSTDSIAILVHSARKLCGVLRSGIPASDFMAAWILLAYDTGLRPGDIRRLRWSQVDFDKRRIVINQHKTGVPHSAPLSQQAIDALKRLREHQCEMVFPLGKYGVRRWEGKIYTLARCSGFMRRKRQGIGTLRKSHATEVYKSLGLAAAAESLGHVGGTRTVKRHYIDASQIHRGHLPPSIE